jgi:hypothetical protein
MLASPSVRFIDGDEEKFPGSPFARGTDQSLVSSPSGKGMENSLVSSPKGKVAPGSPALPGSISGDAAREGEIEAGKGGVNGSVSPERKGGDLGTSSPGRKRSNNNLVSSSSTASASANAPEKPEHLCFSPAPGLPFPGGGVLEHLATMGGHAPSRINPADHGLVR